MLEAPAQLVGVIHNSPRGHEMLTNTMRLLANKTSWWRTIWSSVVPYIPISINENKYI